MDNRSDQPLLALNPHVTDLGLSATLAINEKSAALVAEGHEIYRLGFGQSPFPVPELVVNELRAQAQQHRYLPVRGLPELRSAISSYLKKNQALDYAAEDILIAPGSKELMFLLQLVYEADLVIPAPSWVSYAPQAKIIGRPVRWIPTNQESKWLLTAESLEALAKEDPKRPRLVILNYPSNPAGTTYTEQELGDIAKVARKYEMVVLADEIYGELHHTGEHSS